MYRFVCLFICTLLLRSVFLAVAGVAVFDDSFLLLLLVVVVVVVGLE